MEISDEGQVGRRYCRVDSMKQLLDPEPELLAEPGPLRLARVR